MAIFKNAFFYLLFLLMLIGKIRAQNNFSMNNSSTLSIEKSTGFIQNVGQINNLDGTKATSVYFTYNSSNADIFITNKGISYVYSKLTFTDSAKRKHFDIERVDANLLGAKIDTSQIVLEYTSNTARYNFYLNNIESVGKRTIRKITFKNVYPGIDWVVYNVSDGKKQKIKYDFIVNANGNAENISIQYSSNVQIKLNQARGLNIKSKLGYIDEGSPIGYDKKAPKRKIKLNYRLIKNNCIHFDLNGISRKQYPFVIDPDLYWGTYLHTITAFGAYHNVIKTTDITTDNTGNIYVAGYCWGIVKFPTLNPGGGAYYKDVYDSINGSNIYLKFSESGVLLWATYFTSGGDINGTNGTTVNGGVHITTDSKGNLITASKYKYTLPPPFKNNGGYFDTSSLSNCYLAKFDKSGVLLWCTKYSYELQFHKIVHDDEDNFYIGGTTTGFPYPKKDPGNGAYVHNGFPLQGNFPFVSKFDKNCNLIWSTDIPGSDDPEPTRIAVDTKYKSIYVYKIITRYNGYPIVDGGAFMNTTGYQTLTKFDSSYKMVWSTRLPSVGGGDITTDTSGNVYVVGSSFGGNSFPYVDPGNGAYTDPNPKNTYNGGSILKFDAKTNLVWATTYMGEKNFFFTRVVHEKYRNLIHIYGIMNCSVDGIPTRNDACNGSYYYPSTAPNNYTDPIITSFTTKGKLLYASFNHFQYSYYDISEMNADYKGNLLFEFGYLQEVVSFPFVALKDPGNGAFFQNVSNQSSSEASFIMKLTPTFLDVTTSYTLPQKCDSTGSITITPSCGNGDYAYQWNRGDTTATINKVSPGNYTVKITDKLSGVSKTVPITIPNSIQSISTARISSSNAFCNQKNGQIKVDSIVGGPTPYLFSINSQTYKSAPIFDSLQPGLYSVSVKDNDGCLFNDTVSIQNIAGPQKLYTNITASACNQASGSIHIDSIGSGTAPFTYQLNGNSVAANITGLAADKYVLTVKDSSGCVLTDSIEIKKYKAADSFVPVIDNNQCGQTSGTIAVTKITGGTQPFLYSLDGLNYNSDSVFTNLKAGLKYLFVQDKNACVYKDSVILSFKSFPIVQLPTDTILCNQSTLLLDVTQTAATYIWQDGTDQSKMLISKPGEYIVNVTVNGCTTKDTCLVNFESTPNISLGGNISKCSEDTLRWDISFPNSQYLWQDGTTLPIYYATNAGLYSYTVNNYCGTSKGIINLSTHPCLCMVDVPNIFSPNGDGINDEFKPIFSCTPSFYHLMIFDRNGEPIFETKDSNESWKGKYKGKQVPIGTYYFVLTIKGVSDPIMREKSGGITVIR